MIRHGSIQTMSHRRFGVLFVNFHREKHALEIDKWRMSHLLTERPRSRIQMASFFRSSVAVDVIAIAMAVNRKSHRNAIVATPIIAQSCGCCEILAKRTTAPIAYTQSAALWAVVAKAWNQAALSRCGESELSSCYFVFTTVGYRRSVGLCERLLSICSSFVDG